MSPRPVRVLQVIDTFSMGGAETWLIEALRLWAKNGDVKADFLMTSGNRGVFDDEAKALGATLHYLPYNRRSLPGFVSGLRQILRQGKYDAIHDHQEYSAGWHFFMGGHYLPQRRIIHIHNPSFGIRMTYGVTPSRRVIAAIGEYFVARYSTHITGTSSQILTEFGFDQPAFNHIPKAALHCGFDPDRFKGTTPEARAALRREFAWPVDTKVILMAGRMDESPDVGHAKNHKNTGFAVDVIVAAMKRDPGVCAVFAGKHSVALPVLQGRIAEQGLSERFAFPGIRTDIAKMMLGADLLMFPSRGEGLGMVAVEAQAAGLPVLASTAVPRECVVIPGMVAFKEVEAGPEAWADEVTRLLQMPRDAEKANMSVAASPFAIAQSAQYLSELYRSGALPPQ